MISHDPVHPDRASAVIDELSSLGPIDPRIRGSFVEHVGRCVYGGIFEPGHPEADPDGYRLDVAQLVRELGTTAVRYPGGNFVSGYRWEDGIGPVEDRPTRLDLAWRSIETNQFGLHEMAKWVDLVGAELIYTVNLGTRGIEDACRLLEYANFPSGTALSDLRIANGAREPLGIRTWCLGNEVDGPWQIGHTTASRYGGIAAGAATAMRRIDPSAELIVAGSSQRRMPTFPSWDAEVLEATYGLIDYLALHAYYWQYDDDLESYLAASTDLDRFLDEAIATCDFAQAKARGNKRIDIALDEWNVSFTDESWQKPEMFWAKAPPMIENTYSTTDAVVVGGLLNSILRHSKRVRIACMSLLVNVSAPIRTTTGGASWAQSTYFPLRDVARYAGDVSLDPHLSCGSIETGRYGDVPILDMSATLNRETGDIAIFVVNRDPRRSCDLEVTMRDAAKGATEHLVLDDFGEGSSVSTVGTRLAAPVLPSANGFCARVTPRSWNVFRVPGGKG